MYVLKRVLFFVGVLTERRPAVSRAPSGGVRVCEAAVCVGGP